MQNTARLTRTRTTEIRWIGDALTEAAALEALAYPSLMEAADGFCERWLRVPQSKLDAVKAAIQREGGRLQS